MVKVIFNNVTSPYGLLLIAVIVLAVGRVVFKKKYLNCYDYKQASRMFQSV